MLRDQVEGEQEKLEKRQQMQVELKELKYQNWLFGLSLDDKLLVLDVSETVFRKMPKDLI